jgi:LysM repeat protein
LSTFFLQKWRCQTWRGSVGFRYWCFSEASYKTVETMANIALSSGSKSHTHTWVSLRQPLRCGLTILVCSCVMFGAGQCQARGHQDQDVAAAARQERARKEQAKKSHVYTDEDLKRAKILTPEDEERVAAARKQTPPAVGEATQSALDASLQMPELPLGDIARRYRNAKQILEETAPFHLSFEEPAFAAPIVELPKVAPPLPTFTPSRPRIVAAQPNKVTAPNVAREAPLRRVDPFAPRVAPAEPRASVHTGSVTPHVPSAGTPLAPSLPRMEEAAPGSGSELKLSRIEPTAPKRNLHVATATPHLSASSGVATPIAPRVEGGVPGAQLTLPNMEPAAPKPRPHISPVLPHLPTPAQSVAPASPDMEQSKPDAGMQLVLPGIEVAAPKPALHLAPTTPHVPAAAKNAAPATPRLDGGFSGIAAVMPRVEPKVIAPEAAVTGVVKTGDAARSVMVQRGDSLWKIALQNLGRGARWRELMAANPGIVDPTRLEVGASVVLPNEALSLKTEETSVVVWRGDSLTKIAQANYGRASAWSCVAEANPEITNPNRIYVGQTLKLPKSCKP